MRQALCTGCPVASSIAHSLIKKKSISRPTEKTLNLSLSPSFFVEVGTGSPSAGDSSDQEPEPKVPFIDLDPEGEGEEEEEMAPRPAVDFKERHHKHFSEALPVAPPACGDEEPSRGSS